MTHDEKLAAAADPATATSRLQELAFDEYADVRLTAMTNRAYPIEELAGNLAATNVHYSDTAVDAAIARADQFHEVLWHESARALVLVPMRLTETEDDRYVVSDDAFEAVIRAWDPEIAERSDFAHDDRREIVARCFSAMQPGEGELDPSRAA